MPSSSAWLGRTFPQPHCLALRMGICLPLSLQNEKVLMLLARVSEQNLELATRNEKVKRAGFCPLTSETKSTGYSILTRWLFSRLCSVTGGRGLWISTLDEYDVCSTWRAGKLSYSFSTLVSRITAHLTLFKAWKNTSCLSPKHSLSY